MAVSRGTTASASAHLPRGGSSSRSALPRLQSTTVGAKILVILIVATICPPCITITTTIATVRTTWTSFDTTLRSRTTNGRGSTPRELLHKLLK